MIKFLRNFLAALLALVVFSGFGIFILIGIGSVMDQQSPVVVSDNSILTLQLTRPISDRGIDDPMAGLGFGSDGRLIGAIDIRKALEKAAEDDKIIGVNLKVPVMMSGFGLGEEVRSALSKFKESGKFIFAHANYLSEGGYYLSSVADKLYMSPEGKLELNGLSIEMSFFKGTFKKLGIEPEIFRVGDYKSAVEPFLLDKMSEENALQVNSFLNSIYDTMIDEMANDLPISSDKLKQISNKMEVRNAKDAKELQLVTDLKYYDEYLEILAEHAEVESVDDLNFVDFSDYKKSSSSYNRASDKVAVLIAEGEIVYGKGNKKMIGAQSFIRELKKIREDENIKAVVIRINSPGGDFLASDLMWREIIKTKAVKPVIASMADYAASGGYYMAMATDSIVAQPNTITGSIGIFAIMFNMEGFMADKLGITSDGVSTGEFSNLYSATRTMSDAERAIIQQSVNEGYETFTTKAAKGREMDIATLKSVASGRVWTGSQAKQNGLVDELGGLDDAINIAATKADIEAYKVRYYPEQKSVVEELMDELSGTVSASLLKMKTAELYPYFEVVEKMKKLEGTQARMPFEFRIH